MDVDFHYYATFVAARLAGYSADESLVIATSAQMIDENAHHTVFEKQSNWFNSDNIGKYEDNLGSIRVYDSAGDNKTLLHTYQPIQSFQVTLDVATSGDIYKQSIWAAFHFLPGNFQLQRGTDNNKDGLNDLVSPLWEQRYHRKVEKYSMSEKDNHYKTMNNFSWLCRPHSPMAISIVNNCREMIHDNKSHFYFENLNDEIHESKNKLKLHCYLIGVTMHVFADTWAHQDFCYSSDWRVNGYKNVKMNNSEYSIKWQGVHPELTGRLPVREGDKKLIGDSFKGTVFHWTRTEHSPHLTSQSDGSSTGHGQLGHIPDNSSLVWEYHPQWSDKPIVRNNPIIYFDAFIHLIWAMHCIRTNQKYVPFNYTNYISKFEQAGLGNTEKIEKVWNILTKIRSPTGDDLQGGEAENKKIGDKWDQAIYNFGEDWINLIKELDLYEADSDKLPIRWIPGSSKWILDARIIIASQRDKGLLNHKKNSAWLTVDQFLSLDYFKFNIAAKYHYRFVKYQLAVLGERPLAEDWAGDQALIADDIDAIIAKGVNNHWLQKVLIDLESIRWCLNVNEGINVDDVKYGIGTLVDELRNSDDQTAYEILFNLREVLVDGKEVGDNFSYGLTEIKRNLIHHEAADILKKIFSDKNFEYIYKNLKIDNSENSDISPTIGSQEASITKTPPPPTSGRSFSGIKRA
jgi:hypothetical protein